MDHGEKRTQTRTDHQRVPFSKDFQLNHDIDDLPAIVDSTRHEADEVRCVPGRPLIRLSDLHGLTQQLLDDFWAEDLEQMAPNLWTMSTFSSSNIRPLHCQKMRGRQIVVTEDPRLHLVWGHNRIFIKPLPQYILSHTFWQRYLGDGDGPLGHRQVDVRGAALGFLRSYFYLIKHESDFNIAKDPQLRLIRNDVTWEQFCLFIEPLSRVEDCAVSQRYSYGELRLTRLNFWAKIFLRRFQYEHIHDQYSSFFSRFYSHLLFAFAVLSILLNAMQVETAVEQISDARWPAMGSICRWSSVICLVTMVGLMLFLAILLAYLFVSEWTYAIKVWREKTKQRGASGNCG